MDVQGRHVVVMGLGSFSGGVAVARFMAGRGARVTVTDLAPADKLAASLEKLHSVPLEAMHLGGHCEDDFRSADIVVASPAVHEDNPFVALARSRGAIITTEMNLFFQLCRGSIVGVTGSNGKSTTTAMIHAMLAASGRRAWLGGNIGRSLLEEVDDIEPGDHVVLELSSFQLEDLDELKRSPHTAVITTFTPNHLDRHPSLEAYRAAKQVILRHQRETDIAILNADDADVRTWPTRSTTLLYGVEDHGREGTFLDRDRVVVRRHGLETEFPLLDVLRLPGMHNQSNAAGAVACATALGADPASIRRALASFRTLPHRLELVAEVAGRKFIDDSIATTPESTLAALDALEGRLWLIAGGHDKGLDLSVVARRMAQRACGVALIGQTAPTLKNMLEQEARAEAQGTLTYSSQPATSSRCETHECSSLLDAVRWCYERSQDGDFIVLSPACASFGMFQNFVERAHVFRHAVEQLRNQFRLAG